VAARLKLIRLALFGSPVSRSLSPRIHGQFARQSGIEIEYRAVESTAGALAGHLQEMAAEGARGCNITVPLKHRACELATRLSARARQAGAVNTLRFDREDEWFGDNTDGAGLLRDLRANLDIPVGESMTGNSIWVPSTEVRVSTLETSTRNRGTSSTSR